MEEWCHRVGYDKVRTHLEALMKCLCVWEREGRDIQSTSAVIFISFCMSLIACVVFLCEPESLLVWVVQFCVQVFDCLCELCKGLRLCDYAQLFIWLCTAVCLVCLCTSPCVIVYRFLISLCDCVHVLNCLCELCKGICLCDCTQVFVSIYRSLISLCTSVCVTVYRFDC